MPSSVTKKPAKKSGKTSKRIKSYLVKDYLSDLHKNGMLYAALVRSPYASGKITNIDTSNLPEEYSLFTARELPGTNKIKILGTETEIFCTDEVHYEGEPVAILVGPDVKGVRREAARIPIIFDFSRFEKASEEITKNYNRPIIDIESAMREKASGETQLKASILKGKNNQEDEIEADTPKELEETEAEKETEEEKLENELLEKDRLLSLPDENIIARRVMKTGFFSKADFSQEKKSETELESQSESIDEFFKSFKYDIKGEWEYKDISPHWTETSGALCSTESGILNIYLPTQWPGELERCVSQVIALSDDKIEIRKTLSPSRNMSGTWRSIIIACQTAAASVLTGKSVKLLLSRDEQKKYMKSSLNTIISIRTGVSQEGKIEALSAEIRADAGSQNPFAQEIADRLTVALVNLYSPEHVYIETKIYSTSLPPTSISQEKLDSASFFASECQLMLISEKTGILPDELKLLNIQGEKSPFKYKQIKYAESINAIIRQSDFKRKFASYSLNSKRNPSKERDVFSSLSHRGMGLATGLDGAFFLGSSLENHQQKMELTLEHDGTLRLTAPLPSISITDIWKKTASQMLSIDPSLIQITNDAENSPVSALPECFSSNISVMNNLLKKCCLEIQKNRFQVPLPITTKKSTSSAVKKAFNKKTFTGTPFYATAFGAAIIELESDPYTYKIRIKGIWVAIDCGELLSIKDAENTVRLAIQQELDELVEGEHLSSECTRISFVQSQNPPCQLGELIHNLIPGAFAAALSQAIGTTVSKIPCTTEELYELSLQEEVATEEELDEASEEIEAEDEEAESAENDTEETETADEETAEEETEADEETAAAEDEQTSEADAPSADNSDDNADDDIEDAAEHDTTEEKRK